MERYKDFDAARAEQAGEPLTFRLGGEDFTVPAEVPVGPLLDLANRADLEDAQAFAAFGEFLEGVVIPEQREAFRAVLRTVGFQTMFDVVTWVIEESTGRPLAGASPLPQSPSGNGTPLKTVSLAPVNETRSA